ncbi:ATP-binding protein [Pseudoscardovia radai]|uniref:ATP-binding protein n=1 Tax=Pseudoscardovia radai TaxID=987066 RepID=UPI003993F294
MAPSFVGRDKELETLENAYAKDDFQMVVIYGRRRVGKTALIDAFVDGKPTIYFTASQQNAALNLRDFSSCVISFFGLPASTPAFASWRDAFDFIVDRSRQMPGERIVVVFDEFPYAAATSPSLPSVLQIAIDHGFSRSNVMMILCGSNQGFMESDVLGSKSPLYGRRTAQMKLRPFDYYDAARLLPATAGPEEKIRYYAAFGGTPYYLRQIDPSQTFEQNVIRLCFSNAGLLYEEPMMLLRQEVRDPATYYSLLRSIGNGASTPKQMAEKSGIDAQSVGVYLRTLVGLGIVERTVPFGENPEKSRRGRYRIADPFFAYWHQFVAPYAGLIETGNGESAARRVAFGEVFDTYVGMEFESVCMQWVLKASRENRLGMLVSRAGKWWGSNPVAHEQTDIDVVAADDFDKVLLLGECKWRNSFNESSAIEALRGRIGLVDGSFGRTRLAVFSKRRVSTATREKYAADRDMIFLDAGDLFDDGYAAS